MRVLHVAAEVFPWVKTGGLADVVGALPQALQQQGADVRLLLPGLPAIMAAAEQFQPLCTLGPLFGAARVRLMRASLPGNPVPVYIVDAPYLYRRPGNPYLGPDGSAWSDNQQRFALLGWTAAHLAAGELDPDWTPEIMHAHDWHAGLACAYMAAHPGTSARTVFTIHNLAFQGLFALGDFAQLGLPQSFLHSHGLEFYDQLSFLKAGLKYAHRITTVSPTYAREITTPEFGCGMDGVLLQRADVLSGILNGVDPTVWNPLRDAALAARYGPKRLAGKARCKRALQLEVGLEAQADAPLFGLVSRLSQQKGLDLVLAALPQALQAGAQCVVQGSGEPALEAALAAAALQHPGRVAVRLGYDEALAHRLIAGSDAVLLPSRFEPCGLTQLYGLRYGTLPLVHRVGGLADTVVDASAEALATDRATGFSFAPATAQALGLALQRAIETYRHSGTWVRLMQRAMAQDFSWEHAASEYMVLYRGMLAP